MSKFTRRERFFVYLFIISAMLTLNVVVSHEPLLPNLEVSALVTALVCIALWIESKGWITLKKK